MPIFFDIDPLIQKLEDYDPTDRDYPSITLTEEETKLIIMILKRMKLADIFLKHGMSV